MLTKEYLEENFIFDDDRSCFLWKRKAGNRKTGDVLGTISKDGYICGQIDGKIYPVHRLVWLYKTGEMPIGVIDHINRIKTDNRIDNLRDTSVLVNNENRKNPSKNNQTGYLGVSLIKKLGKYRARIYSSGKCRVLGLFDTAECAHQAYLNEKKIIHAGYSE